MHRTLLALAGAGALLLAVAGAAFAATAPTCERYAKEAIQQYDRMESVRQCRVPDDPRWNRNIDGHYAWCLNAPNSWLSAESNARASHLRRCTSVRID